MSSTSRMNEQSAMADSARIITYPGLVGVLGGMGPLATVDFMQKMLEATPATRDQEHVPSLVSSIPQIPDRTQAFQGKGESPLPALLACAKRLEAAGAGVIVIPCNTAHLWFDDIQANVGIPMLHIVDATLKEASTPGNDVSRIGLLATEATVASGLYVNRASSASNAKAIEWVLPTDIETQEWVSPGIAAVKAGKLTEGRELLTRAAQALHQRGARAVVLGCTEIPVVLNDQNSPIPTIDATAALARSAVDWSRNARSR
ncbi:aspartate/glutamate racemase family protein [Comamonas thiooxydans]|uniref:aspartate/glutamate racemase family protein n=1 Tax=Comamonas thiooxydans TaxID=363952 RepID=UPI001E4776F4|nr:amino acid racemase [Comamonas thiooxydans]